MKTKEQIEKGKEAAKIEAEVERTTIGPEEPKRRRGRPETRVLKIDATPEEVAKAMFAATKPPDPSLRKDR